MKLWEKGIPTDKQIEHFTVGNDRELDLVLAKYDALGSIAHAKMLCEIGLLTTEETDSLVLALEDIIIDAEKGEQVPKEQGVHTAALEMLYVPAGQTLQLVALKSTRVDVNE